MKLASKISLSFFAVALLLAISVSSLFYIMGKDDLQKSIRNNLKTAVASRANHIETYLKMLKISVGELSKSKTLEDLFEMDRNEDPRRPDAFALAMARLKRTKEANPSISEFSMMDLTGKVIASSDERNIGIDKSTDAIFLGAQKDIYIKDAYFSQSTKEPALAVSAPLLNSQTGEFIGVLAARVKLDELNAIATDKTGLGETGEIYIVNKYGYMVTPSRFKKDTFLKQKTDSEMSCRNCHTVMTRNESNVWSQQGRKHPLSHNKMPNVYPDYLGTQVLGAYEYIPQMQWGVLAEINAEEAFRPLAVLGMIFLMLLLIAPLAAWLLGMWIAGAITGPIHRLHQGTEIIGRGNLDYTVSTEANDEVGQLSRAFDKMTANLKKSTTSIENLNKETADREMAQENFRDSENMYHILFERSADAIMTLAPPSWKFTSGNRATVEMFRAKTEEEFISFGPWALSPQRQPDGRASAEKAKEMIEMAMRDGSNFFEWTHKRVGGDEFPATVLLSRVKYDGKTVLQATVRDITKEKRYEQQLTEDRNMLEEKSKELNVALKESLKSREILASMLADNNKIREKLEQSMAQVEKDQQMLLQSEKLASIGQLAAGIAHEINNPTGFIGSNISTLDKYMADITRLFRVVETLKGAIEEGDLAKAQRIEKDVVALEKEMDISYIFSDVDNLLRETKEGVVRIGNIVRDLKTFSHSDETARTTTSLCNVIDSVLNIVWNEIKYKAELKKDYAEDLSVLCNPQQIGQVFINILVNAAQAIKDKGVISIRTYKRDGFAHVEIADTGCGIAKENISRIFDPFFTTKEPGKGTGLGLGISAEIIKRHGGFIAVDSEINRGTTFTVSLPVNLLPDGTDMKGVE